MNGRLLLLVLLTAMFMAAWDGDQTAMQEALARRAERQTTQIASSSPQHVEESPRTHRVTSVSHRKPARQPEVKETRSVAVNVPLPPSIAAGKYQAVSQTGATVLITVPASKSQNAPARDFYVSDSADGERWFLVRITR